jgi:pimeloyl-ACP methyl ester carboxylesterase
VSDSIQPFEIHVPDAVLGDLRERLARTRWPDQIEGAGWDYGAELSAVRDLCTYWREKFDWRRVEDELRRYAHGATEVDGQRLHFLHARSKHADAFPLVVTHGWPGSILEFQKILGPLTDPTAHGGEARDAFHVVCPSIPGYGFSEPTRSRGWDVQRVAEAEIELMRRLGYARYGAQGGDWGAMISTQIGRLDPAHCAGIHLNMALAFPLPDGPPLSETEQRWVAELQAFQAGETGYQQIQGTKPQTLGYGLTDSPAGLCAWIVEKFRTWSDCDGELERRFTKDELLANVTLYWVTGTINSSVRLYYETMKSGRIGVTQGRIEVPTAIAVFPKEIYKPPRAWAEKLYDVRQFTVFERGGHFAAMEEPEALVGDVRRFFRTLRP